MDSLAANVALTDGLLRPGSTEEHVLFTGDLDGQTVTAKASHEGWDGWLHVCAYTTPPPGDD